jgi:1,4-alpha-glucan branching enzyme
MHEGLQRWVRDLNHTYQRERSLHEVDFDAAGFRWIDCNDNENSVVSLVRMARDRSDFSVVVTNFTPVPRPDYRIGVPEAGWYRELLNSDSAIYGGSNLGNEGGIHSEAVPAHGFDQSLRLMVPPLGFVLLKK